MSIHVLDGQALLGEDTLPDCTQLPTRERLDERVDVLVHRAYEGHLPTHLPSFWLVPSGQYHDTPRDFVALVVMLPQTQAQWEKPPQRSIVSFIREHNRRFSLRLADICPVACLDLSTDPVIDRYKDGLKMLFFRMSEQSRMPGTMFPITPRFQALWDRSHDVLRSGFLRRTLGRIVQLFTLSTNG